METSKKCIKNCAMSSSRTEHEAMDIWEGSRGKWMTWTIPYSSVTAGFTGCLSLLCTTSRWKPLTSLEESYVNQHNFQITMRPLPSHVRENLPLTILFCIREMLQWKRLRRVLCHALKVLFSLFKHFIIFSQFLSMMISFSYWDSLPFLSQNVPHNYWL